MRDKDRIELILDVLRDSDKTKKNADILQEQISKHEDARERAIESQAEAQQVINQANAVKSKIFDESKELEDKQKVHDDAVEKLKQERLAFEEEKKLHAKNAIAHDQNVKDHNANVQRFGVDKRAHEAQHAEALKAAQKAQEDAKNAAVMADKRICEAEAMKADYNKKLDDLAALTQRK